MKSKAKMLVILAATMTFVIAACAGSQPTPSITVSGLWKQDQSIGTEQYLQLNEDGTYRLATRVALLETAPRERGQFRLEGTVLTFITSDDSYDCKGQSGSYELELKGQDRLQFVLKEDACEGRANVQPGSWSRVSP